MSVVRITVGILIGAVTLTGVMAAALRLNLNLAAAAIGWCVVVGVVFDLYTARRSRQLLSAYWRRHCTGRLWKRRFPTSSKRDIRQFLRLFAHAFSFPGRQLNFAPDDRVIDIYRALYPDASTPDGLELETFATAVQQQYGISVAGIWREDLTLGELYARAASP
jgi:propanediol dehydratase small subunit